MKKKIKIPSGILGHIPGGYINIELEMKSSHYDDLTTAGQDHFESSVLSILKELMEEDPYLLTQQDLLYVFTLVKISSIGSNLKITTRCPTLIQLQDNTHRLCGNKITFGYSLAKDDDVVYFDGKERPQFKMLVNDKEETFALQLPTMTKELEILETFENLGITRKQLLEDKSQASKYAKMRMVAHLVTNQFTEAELLEALNNGPFSKMNELADLVKEISKYGIKHKNITLHCPACGADFDYHLPLFAGLSV